MVEQVDDPKRAVSKYHEGFSRGDSDLALSVIGSEFFMFNGNYSGEPTNWQAHMYLEGADREQWPQLFLQEAGPYENQFRFIHEDIRGDAAVVVTLENGKNRFRSWENEMVTWFLGRHAGHWKILGLFIRDISNPG